MPLIELTRSGIHCSKVLGVLITTGLVVFCMATYFAYFLVPELREKTALGFVSFFLFVPSFGLLAVSLWRTFFTHPGKVSEAVFGVDHVDQRVLEYRRQQARSGGGGGDSDQSTTAGDISSAVGGGARVQTTESYLNTITPNVCSKCYVYKVHRIHHCSTCGECILRMDHHCPWIGNCVGRDNHKFFILFIFYTIVTGAIMTLTSFSRIEFFSLDQKKFRHETGKLLAQFFGWMFTAMFSFVLIPFLIAIIHNATEGTTTLERKITARKKRRAEEQQRRLDAAVAESSSSPVTVISGGGNAGGANGHQTVRRGGGSPAALSSSPLPEGGGGGGGTTQVQHHHVVPIDEQQERRTALLEGGGGVSASNEPTVGIGGSGGILSESDTRRAERTPLNTVVHISDNIHGQDDEADEDQEPCCCCCNWRRTAGLLEEIFGDSEEDRRQSRLWWLLPVAPTFKQDIINIENHFL